MSAIKIYIAFTDDEVSQFELIKSKKDKILAYGDIATANCVDATSFSNIDLASYVKETRIFFDNVGQKYKLDLKAFSNNALECSIRPTLRYVEALRLLVETNNVSDIVFSQKNLFCKGQVSYYMAEHESQGRKLYSRQASMQEDIVKFANDKQWKVSYLQKNVSFYRVNVLVRDCAVFGFRLLSDFKKSFFKVKTNPNNDYDAVFIVRTRVQFDFIRPLIDSSDLKIAIYCGSSSMQDSTFEYASLSYQSCSNISVMSLSSVGSFLVLSQYLSVLWKYLFLKKMVYSCNKISIDLSQALREVLIMSPEVSIYEFSLAKSLNDRSGIRKGVLFSCEQKSPHAYIDAKIAREKGYRPVQIMCCDQEKNDLPYPVFSDRYLTDTRSRMDLFKKSWSSLTDKLAYEGCIKLLNLDHHAGVLDKPKYDYCYFSHVSEVNQNTRVIAFLEYICDKKNTQFCIKLHPRDNGAWLKNAPRKRSAIFKHGDIGNMELFSSFEIGISNPSAVVMDLLCHAKKFIFLDIIKSYNTIDYVYVDSLYSGVVTNFHSFEEVITKELVKDDDIRSLRERVFGVEEEVFNLTAFVNKFIR
jgi:hypothetical protein